MKNRMYRTGGPIRSLAEVERLITTDQYMMIDNFSKGWKPIHPSMIRSMTIHTILKFIQGKESRLRYAIKDGD